MAYKNDVEIKSQTLYLANRHEKDKRRVDIRVVDWIVNGKHTPLLEKRDFYQNDMGEWRLGKAKGFNAGDLDLLQDHWQAIKDALTGKTKVAASTTVVEPF